MRLTRIVIDNFKNVEHGELCFENKRRPDGPSILALYGQNGSGKSAVVDCLLILQCLTTNAPIPAGFANLITLGAETSTMLYEFQAEEVYDIRYEVTLARRDDESGASVRIQSERVSFAEAGKTRMHVAISLSEENGITPKRLLKDKVLFPTEPNGKFVPEYNSEQAYLDAMVAAHKCGKSFLGAIENNPLLLALFGDGEPKKTEDWMIPAVIRAMSSFGFNLYVVGTKEAESIENGTLSLYYDPRGFPEKVESFEEYGSLPQKTGIEVSTTAEVPSNHSANVVATIEYSLENINHILSRLVPGMTVSLHTTARDDGTYDAYLQSNRDSRTIPLICESRGVQKLVSVAWLLVLVYNDPHATAVIDEIDSGIFEYLLGEILRTVSEEGEGQLIFTSHNLRPLEVMDKGYIAFTTSNPKQRYMRLRNVKATNNLRDFYYRSIYLGGQKESIYDPPTSGDLSMAFMMAGQEIGDSDDDE